MKNVYKATTTRTRESSCWSADRRSGFRFAAPREGPTLPGFLGASHEVESSAMERFVLAEVHGLLGYLTVGRFIGAARSSAQPTPLPRSRRRRRLRTTRGSGAGG